MKDLCVDIIRHDLLNPLSVVNGYVEILQKSETSTQTKAHLKKIKRNLNKALKLIEDVTIFAQLENLKMIEFEDQDLKTVIERVIETFQPIASISGMKIDNNVTQNMPIKAHTIIDEVFANIVSNAIKYAKNGKRIRVEGEGDREFWRINVIDFGEGINNADKTRIFERFMRNDKNGVKGSGLGLAIVKKIMELHNGRVWVEDNPKGGAIFVVEIPKS
jgi:signal transduction histidine kinase